MNEEERRKLKTKITEWQKKAYPVGPQHALWDVIFDAEALLDGRPTLAKGSEREVFEWLMAIE